MRGHPDAKYLVWFCDSENCTGIGNRIRGLIWMLRVAMAYGRVLLVHWKQPAPLTEFMAPHQVDWSTNGLPPEAYDVANTIDANHYFDAVYRAVPTAQAIFNATKTYRTTTNEHVYAKMVNIPSLPTGAEQEHIAASCMFRFLFQPAPVVLGRATERLASAYGGGRSGGGVMEVRDGQLHAFDYVAWHWRHGAADGSKDTTINLPKLLGQVRCAQKLGAERAGLNSTLPVLLLTDFNVMRRAAAGGFFAYLTAPANTTARHIDVRPNGGPALTEAGSSLDTFVEVFVDLYLLSRARCILMSPPSFSDAALWWGGPKLMSCMQQAEWCPAVNEW